MAWFYLNILINHFYIFPKNQTKFKYIFLWLVYVHLLRLGTDTRVHLLVDPSGQIKFKNAGKDLPSTLPLGTSF